MLLSCLLCALFLAETHGSVLLAAQGHSPRTCSSSSSSCDDLEPLLLSEMIREGRSVRDLQAAALVQPQIGNSTSYSGYFTTDAEAKNHMFFWSFPAQSRNPAAPLVIWLQGGPGGSSMFGALVENGPFSVDSSTLEPVAREFNWNTDHHLLYIDNPVGAGFSFTENNGYVENEQEVSENLYSLLEQWYHVFPAMRACDLWITGESYVSSEAGREEAGYGYQIG